MKTKIWIPSSANGNSITLLKHDFEVITNCEYYFIEKTLYKNFDVILIDDGGVSDINSDDTQLINIFKNSGVPVYGLQRITKKIQPILLNQHNINYPKTFFCKHYSNQSEYLLLLKDYKNNDKFILKIDYGARGLGQALLTKRQIFDLYERKLDEKIEEVKSEKKIGYDQELEVCVDLKRPIKLSEGYDAHLKGELTGGGKYIIQEYIEKRLEWRMYWFYNKQHIIVQREMDTDSWQANAGKNEKGKSYVLTENMLKEFYSKVDLNKINDFCNSLNTPYLSLDIYYDLKVKQWGLFEFQMEFGWTGPVGIESEKLYFNIVDSTKKLLKSK